MSPAATAAKNLPSSSPSAPFARPPCAPRKSASASGITAPSPTTRQVLLPSRSASLPSMKLPIASISFSSSPTTLSTRPSALAATASPPPAPQPLCPNQMSPKQIQPHWPPPKQSSQSSCGTGLCPVQGCVGTAERRSASPPPSTFSTPLTLPLLIYKNDPQAHPIPQPKVPPPP